MNLLWIDYWTKKSGIAINFENIAMPLSIISTSELLHDILKLISERKIEKIILWIANHADGRESEITKKIKAFSRVLARKLPDWVEIVFHDERFTSFEAARTMEIAWVKKFDENHLDDVAACIILQSYIDSVN
jgi:putative Holliday junction resolvase